MGVQLEVLAEEVSESVVFLEEDEVRGVGGTLSLLAHEAQHAKADRSTDRGGLTGERLLGDLLLAFGLVQEEELEPSISCQPRVQQTIKTHGIFERVIILVVVSLVRHDGRVGRSSKMPMQVVVKRQE